MEKHASLIPANSVRFEYVYVANQRCECGGGLKPVSQALIEHPSGRPVDQIVARCQQCDEAKAFDFDIHSFFGQFEQYDRFQQVDASFREAMAFAHAGQFTQAAEALRQVIDPEEGEPAFAWAHFHLGIVLLQLQQPEAAKVHLERAAQIQPLEPDIVAALGNACQVLGQTAEHQTYRERAVQLRARFDTGS